MEQLFKKMLEQTSPLTTDQEGCLKGGFCSFFATQEDAEATNVNCKCPEPKRNANCDCPTTPKRGRNANCSCPATPKRDKNTNCDCPTPSNGSTNLGQLEF